MYDKKLKLIIQKVRDEEIQGHATRKAIYQKLRVKLGRPVVSFFTSFRYPVMIQDDDADMLEGVLQKTDLSDGLALFISSPGGDGLSAERIVNICRSYSGTGEFWVIVPGKAKSAATMVCFGASKIIMGASSELGPIDPQHTIIAEGKVPSRFSVYNIVKSYEDLFKRAVELKDGRLEPFLQQLANYDEREIQEFRSALSLAEDIAVRTLESEMMKSLSKEQIREKIKIFLTPEQTKTHGRPIYKDEASGCGLNIEAINIRDELWETIYELYVRINNFVKSQASKCVESENHSFIAAPPIPGR
jgi:ClpP class serine protease